MVRPAMGYAELPFQTIRMRIGEEGGLSFSCMAAERPGYLCFKK